ncbi:MAG TPA: Maf family protein [Anaeromyxobacteraceae bacterium]|nr:Maf family protein [Anaeromyxobacteraceae bacterium]
MRLVLASRSPRRIELLASAGLSAEVRVSDVDEAVRPGEGATDYVRRLAREKAGAVAARPGEVVLAADTSVVLGDEILGKPVDDEDARRMLRALSGRTHVVLTGVHARAVPAGGAGPGGGAAGGDGVREQTIAVSSAVRFVTLSEERIDWYVSTGEPRDKAGAYAVQGAGGSLVRGIAGSVSNVVGLPLAETLALLGRMGVSLPWGAR